MPPRKKVQSLQEIGKTKVLYKVCEVVLDEIYFSEDEEWEVFNGPCLSIRLQTFRDILVNSLNPIILQNILNLILEKDDAVDPTVRYITLQLLLVEGVTTLNVGHFPETFYEHILESIADSAAKLKRLDLKGLWIGAENKLYLCKILRRLTSIKYLTLRYKCDDELLGVIGKYCSNMETLDISGSLEITEVGFNNLVNGPRSSDICKSLKVIDLGGDGVSRIDPEIVYKMLIHLPNLASIGTYDKSGTVLDLAFKKNPEVKFKLQYIHDLFTTSEKMLAIVKTCPDLKAVYLDSPKGFCLHNLDILKEITELKLHKVRWSDLVVFLNKCGKKVKSLFLLSVFGQLDLLELGILCPNIIRLELHRCSLICSGTAHNIAFRKIKQCFIYTSEITTLCVKLILNQCVQIQHLSLGMCGHLTDAAVISCLMDHSLKEVEALWFGQAENLTMRTIDALMDHCPLLNSLGNLAGWDINHEEIMLKKIAIDLENMDLVLHDIGPDGEDGDEDVFFL